MAGMLEQQAVPQEPQVPQGPPGPQAPQESQGPPQEQQGPPQEGQEPQGQSEAAEEMSPQMKKDIEQYAGGLSKMLHGKETRNKVYDILKSAPPDKSIPQAAMVVNARMEQAWSQSRQKRPELGVLLQGGVHLVTELSEIYNAGGFSKQEITQDNFPKILQDTMQMYIQDGLKKKTIDPVELQKAIEPLLNDEQKQMGSEVAQKEGVPQELGVDYAMDKYADQRVQEDRATQQKMQERKQFSGALRQAQGGR